MKNIENEKIGKIVAQMDINLDDMIVTYRTVTRVLMSMIEFLSFNRHQIPMVFETFTHLTSNLEKQQLQQNSDDCPEMKNFALDRQRELVITTNQNFRDMSNVRQMDIRRLLFEKSNLCEYNFRSSPNPVKTLSWNRRLLLLVPLFLR